MNKKYSLFIPFFLLTFVGSILAQSTTNSPYSRYGIGVLRPETFSKNFALGGTGIGLRSYKDVNFLNPASYSGITITTFEAGFVNNALYLEDGSESQFQNNPYINHIAFAFPAIKNIWGFGFGILPYANTGYEYTESINDDSAGNVSFLNEGEGSINKVFWGNGVQFKVDKSSEISLGITGYFLFGSSTLNQNALFNNIPNALNIEEIRDIVVSDFGADFGIQYEKRVTGTRKFIFGATYDLATSLKTENSRILRTFVGNREVGSIRDTLESTTSDGAISLPSEFGFGVSYKEDNKWLIALDYKIANWGDIISNDPIFNFNTTHSVAIGGEYTPNYKSNNFFKRLSYRLGARRSNAYITVNETEWNEHGITFGLGIPIEKSGSSFPRIHLGVEYGSRGTTDNGLIKESFTNFNFGITINALWFQKRKYN